MKQANTRAGRSRQIRDMVILALFTAIIILFTFTPVGYIDLPIIKATILHVPVIMGSILLGPKKGAFLGAVFGVTSIIKNTLMPSLLSFAFSPFIPVPGLDRGSPWALVIALVPRILVGVTPWLVYKLVEKICSVRNVGVQAGGMVVASVVGAFTNTALVMGTIYFVFRDAYAAANNMASDAVLGAILGVVATNGVPEAIVAAVITPALCVPLIKALKLDRQAPAATAA